MAADDNLPFIDEHRVRVAAPAPVVWRALATALGRSRPGGTQALAGLLAAQPRHASGKLFDEGAAVPGFAVTEAVPGKSVRLTGRHRFSRYALTFTLAAAPDGTTLSASTHARFPGLHGRLYRALVIGSGAHRVVTTRLLRAIRRRAEREGVVESAP